MGTRFLVSKRFALSRVPLQKSLDSSLGFLKEGMAEKPLFKKYPHLKNALTKGMLAQCVVVMIDLSPFADFTADASASEIKSLLEGYYDFAVEIIVERGGVVEKYIGDAIVAVFGAPFNGGSTTTKAELFEAFCAGRDLIAKTNEHFKGELSAKCAIAFGSCFIGYVGPDEHPELTVVGTPLTMMFRLEDRASKGSVILETSLYEQIADRIPITTDWFEALSAQWIRRQRLEDLRGIGPVAVTEFQFQAK